MATLPRPHTKATRDDWVAAARSALGETPIDGLRVLNLAGDLSVSRSSFYWYFADVDELHAELLAIWARNTASIVERCERSTPSIVAACLGVFECWADEALFDPTLDLAVRDWGRRDVEIATRVADADLRRLDAIAAMFAGHGFDPDDSTVRARLLYHSQVGYYAVGTDEPMDVRVAYLPYYLEAMCAAAPTDEELAAFISVLR